MRKITSLLTLLLLFVAGTAVGATYTITFDHSQGTFYKGGAVATGWVNQWKSNEAGKPVVTITASANNINTDNGRMAPGQSGTCTYTISVEDGYIVTGFSMNCPTFGADVTVTPAGESAVVVATGGTLVVNSSASSFVYSGSNSGRIQASAGDGGTFTITVADDPWKPAIDGAYLSVGEKVSSFSTVSDPADNTKWYVLTQIRGGETPMYDVGEGQTLKRTATSITTATLSGLASDYAAYLIRFVDDANTPGNVHIQFANGRWITSSLTTGGQAAAGSYTFYNCNGGSGSYFAWNLNSKSGSRVDNNGAGYTVSFWDAGEVSGTSGNNVWYLYETTVEVPASTVDVTYNFVVGGNIVNTEVVTVPANSAVSIPAGLTAGYSSDYYTFNTTGTIGSDNCTITVTATLNNASIVYPYTNISNAKSYYVKTRNNARGGLSTYTDASDTYLAISIKDGLNVSPKKFAFISYENNYYLYSVEDQMFVTFDGSNNNKALLASTVTGTTDRVAFSQTVAPLYEIRFDGNNSKIFNGSNSASYPYGMIFNSWGSSSNQWDDGCQYTIEEAGDFDPTSALAALEEYFHPAAEVQYAKAIAQLKAIPFGTGLNQYSFTGDYAGYTSQAANIIEGLENQGYTAYNLEVAQALLANYALNLPEAGFYRIKGYSNNYITSNTAGNNASMNGTPSADNIVYYSAEGNLIFYGSGYGLYNTHTVAPVGSTLNTYTFMQGAQLGKYYVKSNASGMGTYCYDNTANGSKVDRNTAPVTSGSYQTDWTLEEVSELPIALNAFGGSYYSTFYSPVNVEVSGATAYTLTLKSNYLSATEISDGVIPANTGVVLVGNSAAAKVAVTDETPSADSGVLTGTVATATSSQSDYIFTVVDNEIGFYKNGYETVKGFKAFYRPSDSSVRGFAINFGLNDAITDILHQVSPKNVYDLQGRRVKEPAKGLYIINGKKVIK